MTEATHSTEHLIRIWNDSTGERIEFGPDNDGIDLWEIRYYGPEDAKPCRSLVLTETQARELSCAINSLLPQPF